MIWPFKRGQMVANSVGEALVSVADAVVKVSEATTMNAADLQKLAEICLEQTELLLKYERRIADLEARLKPPVGLEP